MAKETESEIDGALAVLSCFFGVVSVLRLFAMVYAGLVPEVIRPYTSMLLAAVGLLLGIIAWMRLRRSQGTKRRWGLVVLGLLLSILVLICALYYLLAG